MKKSKKQKRVDYFIERCKFYIEYLGLKHYEFFFQQKEIEERGKWNLNWQGRIISISFGKDWIESKNVNFKEIDKVAFHEVYECSLSPIVSELQEHISYEKSMRLIHETVRRMENTLFEFIKDEKA